MVTNFSEFIESNVCDQPPGSKIGSDSETELYEHPATLDSFITNEIRPFLENQTRSTNNFPSQLETPEQIQSYIVDSHDLRLELDELLEPIKDDFTKEAMSNVRIDWNQIQANLIESNKAKQHFGQVLSREVVASLSEKNKNWLFCPPPLEPERSRTDRTFALRVLMLNYGVDCQLSQFEQAMFLGNEHHQSTLGRVMTKSKEPLLLNAIGRVHRRALEESERIEYPFKDIRNKTVPGMAGLVLDCVGILRGKKYAVKYVSNEEKDKEFRGYPEAELKEFVKGKGHLLVNETEDDPSTSIVIGIVNLDSKSQFVKYVILDDIVAQFQENGELPESGWEVYPNDFLPIS